MQGIRHVGQVLCSLQIIVSFFIVSACEQGRQETKNNSTDITETLLLKNYQPESIFNIPVTEVRKSGFPAIDMHAHDYAGNFEEVDSWIKTMDNAGIKKTIILTQSYGPAFDSVMNLYSRYPDRFEVWCGIDYSDLEDPSFPTEALSELERCFKLGAKGVGELGDKGKGMFFSKPAAPGLHPDDPRMDAIWEKCAELGMPVSLHVADPKWMYEKMDSTNDGMMNAYKWRLDNQPGIVDHAEMIKILERTVKKHPNTTFIACHVANCSYDLNLIGRMLEDYPNLYIDISARFAELSATPRATLKFFDKFQDKIVYGTDMGTSPEMYSFTFRILETTDEHIYHRYNTYHWPLHGLQLPDPILEKIYNLNALTVIQD
jgi:predicted TIM-barrel fold metal-dependent hydrolase